MPELTENQIADLRALEEHCRALGADLVIIGAIAYQVHFPREDRHTGDIDFAVALDLDEFAELERRLLADKWIRLANREHRWRSPRGTILDLLPAGPKLRKAKQVIRDPFSSLGQHPTGPFPSQARDWRASQKSSNDARPFARFADPYSSTTLQRHYVRLCWSQPPRSSFLVSARSLWCSVHQELQR